MNPLFLVPYPNHIDFTEGSLYFDSLKIEMEEKENVLETQESVKNFIQFAKIIFGSPFIDQKSETELSISPIEHENEGYYELNIREKRIEIKYSSSSSLQYAFITLLQLIMYKDEIFELPKLKIEDCPYASYRGLMIDVARHKHTLEDLKKVMFLCYWYKLNYLHIHFTDNQSYTLPSRIYPGISTPNWHFSFEEIEELKDYAKKFHITIVPELETPGHSTAMNKAYPEIFSVQSSEIGDKTINIGKEAVYEAVDNLIGELCELFPESPIIHMGCDEVKQDGLEKDPDASEYMKKYNISSPQELYRHFIVRLNEMVKKRGKKLAIWEGFRPDGHIEIPKDILIYEFECTYNPPDNIVKEGYDVINTSWKPIYVVRRKHWSLEEIYAWNMYRWENHAQHSPATKNPFQLKPTNKILGAQMCSWEQTRKEQIRSLRRRVAPLSENVWNKEKALRKHGTLSNEEINMFMERLKHTDEKLIILMKNIFLMKRRDIKKEKNTYKG